MSEQPVKRPLPPWPEDFLRLTDYRARCYVCGSTKHSKTGKVEPVSGGWSPQFKNDPRVIEAERDGWSKDLRSAMIQQCKFRIMADLDLGTADDLMPTRAEWWQGARENAKRYRRAAEWQEKNLTSQFQIGNVANKLLDSIEKRRAMPALDRNAWAERQENRRVSEFHRRVMGEKD